MAQQTVDLARARHNADRLRARFTDPQDDPQMFAVIHDVYDLANEVALTAAARSAECRKVAALTGPQSRERLARHLFLRLMRDRKIKATWDDTDESQRDQWRKEADELLAVIAGEEG